MKCKDFFGGTMKVVMGALLCAAINTSAQSTLSLNFANVKDTIGKALYGTLMENYGRGIYGGVYVGNTSTVPNTNGMRNDVIEGFKEAGLGCIEWPGGCFADSYHWADGIGMPQSSRSGGEMTNGLGTNEYFQLCSLSTAIPYITANIQSGSSAENVAWQKYIDTISTHPLWKNMIKFWKIGNEEWNPCGSMTQASYQTKFDQFYSAETATWQSRCRHVMDGGSGGGWFNADASYQAAKTYPMGISFHCYAVTSWTDMGPSSGFTTAQYYAQLQAAWGMNNSITGFENTLATVDPNNKVGICVDEWGAWYNAVGNDAAGHALGTSFNWSTMRDAVIVAMNLNIFNNHCHRVKMALSAQPVNVIQSIMLTQPTGEQNIMKKTPAFWVYKMLKPHQLAKMVPSTITTATNQNIPVLNASASVDSNNILHISIVNTHDANTQSLTITLANSPQTYTGISGQIVNGAAITSGTTSFTNTDTASLQSFTNFTVAGSTITTTLPAHSVVMLTLTPVSAVLYDSKHFAQNADKFAVSTTPEGKIVVNYRVNTITPAAFSLYGVDGKMMGETFNSVLKPGSRSLVWQPKNLNLNEQVYFLKMNAGEYSQIKRLIFTR